MTKPERRRFAQLRSRRYWEIVAWRVVILAAVLLLYVAWFLFFPVLFAITPKGIFDQQLGFMTIDTQAETSSIPDRTLRIG